MQVREATPADRPELVALLSAMMPACDPERRIAWMYDTNPAGRALTWLAEEGGEIAGCTSFFPFRLQVDHDTIVAALGGDNWVQPEFRRRGVGAALHATSRAALATHGLACMYGAPGAMNVSPLKHGGSREVGTVSRWVRPLRGAALGITLRALDELVHKAITPRPAAKLEPMVRFDPRVDTVWTEARAHIGIAAVRDAAFYTWRFLDAPAGREPAFVILQDDRPIGACALEPMSGGRDVRIVDLVTVPDAWHDALIAIVAHASHTSAATIDIKLMSLDGRRRKMWRSAFAERERKPFLVMLPRGGDRRLVDPLRWFYGGADSDLDSLD